MPERDFNELIYCSKCGKVIGVSYNRDNNGKEYVLHNCLCIECHNKRDINSKLKED